MPIAIKKIVPATLRQQIVQEVRMSILNRSLVPGERLVERELAARLGTSLTAIREALIQLEMDGLIVKKPNATTHVVQLTPAEVSNIYTVRHLLERHAFGEAARVATDDDVKLLEKLHKKAVEYARKGDGVAYISSDLEWHEAVWRVTRNNCLVETLRRVTLPLFGVSLIEMATKKGFDLIQDAMSHRPLLKAIRAHDPVLAGQALEQAEALWRHNT
jgi:DNA-binding GntR family transcriptional regulator